MPSKKQRRRRQKELRHEWEEVYLDAEGNELPPEEAEKLLPERDGKRDPRKEPRKTQARRPTGRGAARGVQPPSWKRVLKRAAIFAPIMYVFVALTSRDEPAQFAVITTLWLLIIFLPFSYVMDSVTYRLWKKRQAKLEGR
jgi:hypothetical protein